MLIDVGGALGSLPMWERGLKLVVSLKTQRLGIVAPHVGAWIETILVPL